MTKIFGLACAQSCGDIPGQIRRMLDMAAHSNSSCRVMWADQYAGLGSVDIRKRDTHTQADGNLNGGQVMVRCGSLVDIDFLKNRYKHREQSIPVGDNEFLSYLLDHEPIKVLASLNGAFALARWSPYRHELLLVNDRYGLQPIYYHHNSASQKLIFASDLRTLLTSEDVSRRIDWAACSTFLHIGHHLGEDTFLKDVYVLPPASVLRYRNDEMHIEKYWNMGDIAVEASMSYSHALDGCVETFAESIRRRSKLSGSKTIVFLSGGLDSGRIVAELSRQKCSLATYTTRGFNYDDGDRIRAKQVADILGVKNTFIDLPKRDFLIKFFPEAAYLCDYETHMHQWTLPLVRSLPEGGLMNYDGLGGDIAYNAVRRDGHFQTEKSYVDMLNRSNHEIAEIFVAKRKDFSILNSEIRRCINREHAIESVVRELNKFETSQNKITCYYLNTRSRRATALAPIKLISTKAESYFPFYDNEAFEFIMSVPPLMRIQNKLRLDHLAAICPQLVEVYKRGERMTAKRDDIHLGAQRRAFWFYNVRQHFLKHNSLFDNRNVIPRIVGDGVIMNFRSNHISYPFNLAFLVFYSFIERVFPGIQLFNMDKIMNDPQA